MIVQFSWQRKTVHLGAIWVKTISSEKKAGIKLYSNILRKKKEKRFQKTVNSFPRSFLKNPLFLMWHKMFRDMWHLTIRIWNSSIARVLQQLFSADFLFRQAFLSWLTLIIFQINRTQWHERIMKVIFSLSYFFCRYREIPVSNVGFFSSLKRNEFLFSDADKKAAHTQTDPCRKCYLIRIFLFL